MTRGDEVMAWTSAGRCCYLVEQLREGDSVPSTRVLFVTAALLCAGCVTTTMADVSSHLERAADLNPRRIFVVSRLPVGTSARLGPSLEKDLERRVQAQLARCGVSATGYAVQPPEDHDDAAVTSRINAFKPDAVLLVDTNGSLLDQYGGIVHTRYAFRLLQGSAANDKAEVVWTAKAVYHPHGLGSGGTGPGRPAAAQYTGSMERYVDAVFGKMKADGFFPGCPADPLPYSGMAVSGAAYAPRSTLTATGSLALGKTTDLRKPDEGSVCPAGSGIGTCGGSSDGFDRLNGTGVAEFAPTVGDYAGAALLAELRHMGIRTGDASPKLDLEIQEARSDGSGWGFGCHLAIRFTLREAASGKVLYGAVKEASAPVGAIGTEVEAVNVALRRIADMLVMDPEFEAAIR